jgi:hypothetical protein
MSTLRLRPQRAEVLVRPTLLEAPRRDVPQAGADLPRLGTVRLEVLVEMNDVGQDLLVFGLDGRVIGLGRRDQQAERQRDQRRHQPHGELDDVDGVAAEVMLR